MSLIFRNLNFLKPFRKSNLISSLSSTIELRRSVSLSTPREQQQQQQQQQQNKRDEPVRFSTSEAKKWDSMNTFVPEKGRRVPPSQPYIVVASFVVFLTYFLYLREENELDVALMRPLEESVPNIKEFTLRKQIEQYDSMGLDSSQLKQALGQEIKSRIGAKNNNNNNNNNNTTKSA